MAKHRSYRKPNPPVNDDVRGAVEGVVDPRIVDAAVAASARLADAGVRHALVGGLAVGVHGYPRATKDVDFLVGEEAFVHHGGGFVTMAAGVPIEMLGVAVDSLSIVEGESFLEAELASPKARAKTVKVPVIGIEALFYLKLKSKRMKDTADLVELLKRGADSRAIAKYLEKHAPAAMQKKLSELVARAVEEAEEE